MSYVDDVENLACNLQDKIGTGADERQWQLVGHAAIAQAILEAVRALKPAPVPPELESQARAIAADQNVQRIKQLENKSRHDSECIEQLRAENERLEKADIAHAHEFREYGKRVAAGLGELQRFRDREEKVQEALTNYSASHDGDPHEGPNTCRHCALIAAVRDFKGLSNA